MDRDFRRYGPWLVVSIAAHGVWLGYQPSQAAVVAGPTVEPVALMLSGFISAPAATATVDPVIAEPPRPAVRREPEPEPVAKRSAAAPKAPAPAVATPRPASADRQTPPAELPRVESPVAQSAAPEVAAPTPAPAPTPVSEPPQPIVTSSPRYAEPPAVPTYPPLARRRGWQGEVLLAIDVAATGAAGEPVILRSSGFDLLDRAALEVARQWRIVPERRNGVAMPTRVEVPVQFALR